MELTCIVCPRGCTISYDIENGEAVNITGNTCQRGKNYCENEVKAPVRMITGTVRIEGAAHNMLPVITSSAIPKGKIFDVMEEIHKRRVTAPVKTGDVIIENVCDTGVDIIASRTMEHTDR